MRRLTDRERTVLAKCVPDIHDFDAVYTPENIMARWILEYDNGLRCEERAHREREAGNE